MAIQLRDAGLPKITVMFTGACLTSAALCDVISAIGGIPWSGRVMGAGGAGIGRLSSDLRRGSREGIGGHQSRRTNACQTHNRCCLSSSPSHSAEPWEELQMCHHSSLVVSLSLAYITSQYTTAFLRSESGSSHTRKIHVQYAAHKYWQAQHLCAYWVRTIGGVPRIQHGLKIDFVPYICSSRSKAVSIPVQSTLSLRSRGALLLQAHAWDLHVTQEAFLVYI